MGRRRARAQARTILIVEDRQDQREMYAAYFEAKHFNVLTAINGIDAIHLAHTKAPDVIVTDLTMPHLDGWETAKRLKGDPATQHIPIIACSAHVLGGAAERAMVAGCNAYVGKPCLPEDLMAEVLRLLEKTAA